MVVLAALLAQVGPAQQSKGKQVAKTATKQTSIPPGDWPLYSRDLASDRFSPLTQINTTNVAQLKQAWTYRPPAPPAPPDNGKGGGKGKAKAERRGSWRNRHPSSSTALCTFPAATGSSRSTPILARKFGPTPRPARVANRSVGYWPGDGTIPRGFFSPPGTNMMAVNANTGTVDPGFGKEGSVDIGIGWGGAPYVYKN